MMEDDCNVKNATLCNNGFIKNIFLWDGMENLAAERALSVIIYVKQKYDGVEGLIYANYDNYRAKGMSRMSCVFVTLCDLTQSNRFQPMGLADRNLLWKLTEVIPVNVIFMEIIT